MAELEIFDSVLRTKAGIYGMIVAQDFYSFRKVMITITNPPAQDSKDGKGRYARFFLTPQEIPMFVRKLKAGVAAIRQQSGDVELLKLFKGGRDGGKRFGVDLVSRVFTLTATSKGRMYAKITLSKGEQMMTRNGEGKSVPGVIKPAGGPPLETVSFGLTEDAALDLAFALEKEYTAWRTALNIDFFYHPDKYAYHGDKPANE